MQYIYIIYMCESINQIEMFEKCMSVFLATYVWTCVCEPQGQQLNSLRHCGENGGSSLTRVT